MEAQRSRSAGEGAIVKQEPGTQPGDKGAAELGAKQGTSSLNEGPTFSLRRTAGVSEGKPVGSSLHYYCHSPTCN